MSLLVLISAATVAGYLFQASRPTQAAQNGPKLLHYQARVTDALGVAVPDGSLNVKILFWDAASGGTCVYSIRGTCGTPTAKTVTVTNGIFSTLIGDTGDTALPDTSFDSDATYLGLAVGADAEMTPRKRLGAVAYAFNADRLDDMDSTTTGAANSVLATTSGGNLALLGNVTVNTNKFFVDATSGNVGIGTSSPAASFHVVGTTTRLDTGLAINTNTGGNGIIVFDTNNGARVYIPPPTNFGYAGTIEISQPNMAITLIDGNSDVGGGISRPGVDSGELKIFSSSYETFFTNSVERMRILSTGNVGIGTTSPSAKLEVSSTGAISLLSQSTLAGTVSAIFSNLDSTSASSHSVLASKTFTGGGDAYVDLALIGQTIWQIAALRSDSNSFAIGRGGTDTGLSSRYLTITSSGNVGIGTSSPGAKLELSSTGATSLLAQSTFAGTVAATFSNLDATSASSHSVLTSKTFTGGGDAYVDFALIGQTVWQMAALRSDSNSFAIGRGGSDTGLSSRYLTITTSGNIGVGTSTPGALMDLAKAEDTEHLRLSDTTNTDSIGQFVGVGTPESLVTAQLGSIYFDTGGSAYLKTSGDNTNTGWQQIAAGGSGANTSLSNLTTTSINQTLLPDSDLGRNLGSGSLRWGSLFVGPSSLHVASTSGETTTARDWSLGISTTAGPTLGNFRLREGSNDYMSVTPTGDIGIGTTSPGAKFHVNAGTMTTDVYPVLIGGTWNNAGVDFTGVKVNMTDTTSGSATKLLDLQVGGVSKFSVQKDGSFTGTGKFTVGTTAGPGDPSGVNGDVVYNISLGKLRCFEAGSWTNCVTAAGSAGGWTDFGAYLLETTSSDNVGIGISGVPTARLELSGSSKIYGGQMDLNTSGAGITNIGTGSSTGAILVGNTGNTLSVGTTLLSQTTNSFALGSDTNNFSTLFLGGTGIIFEGATDNAFETTLNVGNPTADRVINFPDASGNVLLDSNTAIITLAGSTGSSQSIGFGDTLSVLGGANISSVASATDTVTISVSPSPTFTSVSSPSYTGAGAVSLTSGSTNSLTMDTSSASGSVLIGTTSAGALTIGRSAVVTTVNGTLTANTFTSTGATITGGSINSTPIGNSTPSTAVFTTLSTTGNSTIGDAITDRMTMTGEFVLGSITANPTGTNGMMFYNTTDNKFRCFENSTWIDCVSSAAGGGWTDDGTIVRLTTGTDQVRINTSAAGNGQALEVNGVIRSITGGIQFPDGSIMTTAAATASGVSSITDVNIESNTDNSGGGDVIISTSTSERMRINSAGNVGIGTSGPGAKLDVAGSFTANGAINLNQNSNNATAICTGGSCNSTVTIGNTDSGDGGTPTVSITSPGWTIDTAGNASGFGTIGADGRITASAGLTTSGQTTELNRNSNFNVQICDLGGCNGTVSIGNNDPGDGGTPLVNLTSAGNWSITNGGTFATASTITSSGLITGNSGLTINTGAVNLLTTGASAINMGSNTTFNGTISIGNNDPGDGGTPLVNITSAGNWSITNGGTFATASTITSSGLITSNNGLTSNTGAVNLAPNSTAVLNIGANTNYNGAMTIGNADAGDGGTPTIIITSPGWTIDTAGNASGFGTIGADGRITASAGLTVSGQTTELNRNSNFNVQICDLGGCNGTVSIGNNDPGDGGTPLVNITSAGNWSITNGGTFATASTITSSGLMTGNNGLTINTGAVNLLTTGVNAINMGSNTTFNGTISIGNNDPGDGGTPLVNITSGANWSITNGGTFSTAGTITSSGLMTGNSGITTNTGAVNLLPTGAAAINLGSNTTYNGTITIGNTDPGDGGTPTLNLRATDMSLSGDAQWSIAAAGTFSTSGEYIGSGGMDINTGRIRLRGAAETTGISIGTNTGFNDSIVIGNSDPGDGGTPTLVIDTPGWSVSTGGNMSGIGTISSDGLITGTAGLTISGAINLNTATNAAFNLCTGDACDGAMVIGNSATGSGGVPSLSLVGGTAWSIGTTGTFANSAGATITSSGRITGNGGLTIGGSTVLINDSTNATVGICTGDTCDSTVTIGNTASGSGGTPTVNITAGDVSITGDAQWSITAAGAISAAGNMSITGGASISNGIINLNQNTNNAINICTGDTCDSLTTIGNSASGSGGVSSVAIVGGTSWGVTSGGVVSSSIPGSAFTERLCWDGSGISDIADCTGTPGDYAEMYGTSDRHVEAGDIVMLDASRGAVPVVDENGVSTSKAYVLKSDKANSPLVFGVVATAPNETIGQAIPADELPRPIALSGRVPVKVNEENGHIAIGDPITSSSVPGVGMKATQNGMIVGFALSASTGVSNETVIVSVHTGWWNGAAVIANTSASGVSASTASTFHIYNDTDYALYSIYNIRSISGMNWSISEQGNAIVKTISTQKLTITKTADLATIGEGTMRLGEQSLTIANAAMDAASKVFLSWRGNPGSFAMITNRAAGSFTIGLAEPATADAEFDYWIVAVDDQTALVPAPVIPATTTTLTEPATTTVPTESATTTVPTAPAEIIVSPTVDSAPVPAPIDPVPVDPVPVEQPVVP